MNQLAINKPFPLLQARTEQQAELIHYVAEHLPAIQADNMALGGRRQSQFMNRVLTCSKATPIRNLRQVLAEFEKVRAAIQENAFRLRKKEIQAKIIEEKAVTQHGLKRELLEVQAQEIRAGIESSQQYINGAIKKAAEFVKQRESILKHLGVEEITEEILEQAEEEYHIKTAFTQAYCAAHANGSKRADEGNTIYFQQLGIPVPIANACLHNFITLEKKMMLEGTLEAKHFQDFLDAVYQRFKGCSQKACEMRGLTSGPVQFALQDSEAE